MRRGRISAIDTVLVGAQIINASSSRSFRATSIRSNRRVVSICMFHAGNTDNVIPQTRAVARHGAQFDAESARAVEKRIARGGGRHGGGLWRQGQAHLHATTIRCW